MKVISPGSTFCASGAVVLTPIEKQTIKHALVEERDRVARAGGDYYGDMTIEELNKFIKEWGA